MSQGDRQRGWNWTYWADVQRPLLVELTDAAHTPALLAPLAARQIQASAPDIAVSAREAGGFLYLIAVRRSATAAGTVRFTGLPSRVTLGTVLAHPGGNPARPVAVAGGAFIDRSPFAPHNARVYRFAV